MVVIEQLEAVISKLVTLEHCIKEGMVDLEDTLAFHSLVVIGMLLEEEGGAYLLAYLEGEDTFLVNFIAFLAWEAIRMAFKVIHMAFKVIHMAFINQLAFRQLEVLEEEVFDQSFISIIYNNN